MAKRTPGAKAPFFLLGFIGTAEAVPYRSCSPASKMGSMGKGPMQESLHFA
jgi:hypothetical protein